MAATEQDVTLASGGVTSAMPLADRETKKASDVPNLGGDANDINSSLIVAEQEKIKKEKEELRQRQFEEEFLLKCFKMVSVVSRNKEMVKREVLKCIRVIIQQDNQTIFISEIIKLFQMLAVYAALTINAPKVFKKTKPKAFGDRSSGGQELEKLLIEGIQEIPGFDALRKEMEDQLELICLEIPELDLIEMIKKAHDPFFRAVRASAFFIQMHPETPLRQEEGSGQTLNEEDLGKAATNMVVAFDLFKSVPSETARNKRGWIITAKQPPIDLTDKSELNPVFEDYFWGCMTGHPSDNVLLDRAQGLKKVQHELRLELQLQRPSDQMYSADLAAELVGLPKPTLASVPSPTAINSITIADTDYVQIKAPRNIAVKHGIGCLKQYEWEVLATFVGGSTFLSAMTDAMIARSSVISVLRIYPDAFDKVVPRLIILEAFAMLMGTVAASHAIAHPGRPVHPMVKLWKALNESGVVFAFCLGSAIELTLIIDPSKKNMTDEEFWLKIAPFAIGSCLLHLLSAYLKAKEAYGYTALNVYTSTILNSRILDRFIMALLRVAKKTTHDRLAIILFNTLTLIPGFFISLFQNVANNPKNCCPYFPWNFGQTFKQRINMMMFLLTVFNVSQMFLELLTNTDKEITESRTNVIVREALWGLQFLYSIGFTYKYARIYLAEFTSPEALLLIERAQFLLGAAPAKPNTILYSQAALRTSKAAERSIVPANHPVADSGNIHRSSPTSLVVGTTGNPSIMGATSSSVSAERLLTWSADSKAQNAALREREERNKRDEIAEDSYNNLPWWKKCWNRHGR